MLDDLWIVLCCRHGVCVESLHVSWCILAYRYSEVHFNKTLYQTFPPLYRTLPRAGDMKQLGDDLDADALVMTAEEEFLLASVTDADLRSTLLFDVLRAPVGEPVDVQVNIRMGESDSFTGASLEEILKNGVYVPAQVVRGLGASSERSVSFALHCESHPELDRSYIGDDVMDKLLQYFAKELILPDGKQGTDMHKDKPQVTLSVHLHPLCSAHKACL